MIGESDIGQVQPAILVIVAVFLIRVTKLRGFYHWNSLSSSYASILKSVNFDQLYIDSNKLCIGQCEVMSNTNRNLDYHSPLSNFISSCKERLKMVNNFLIFDVGCNGGINALADIATVVSSIEEGLKMTNYFLITYVGS